tara:strand:+ start:106 stop:342 length:237 start_codon:yes stop_codon:yes gene_type:complete
MTNRTETAETINPRAWYLTTEDGTFGPFATKSETVFRTPGTDGWQVPATRIAPGVYALFDCYITLGAKLDAETIVEEY